MFDFLKENGEPPKKDASPPPSKPKSRIAMIMASRNVASFVDDYVTSVKAKQNIRKAIARKNPSKSYGEIYSNLYDFSYYVSFLCHCISFMLALSFGQIFVQEFGQTVLGFTIAVALSYIIAAVTLGAMEWGQSVSLDVLFNVKFLTGRLPIGILILCLGLSAISILSSTYSMSHLFADRPLYARIGVGISLINELGILSLAYWRHAYEFKAEAEATLLNDLQKGFDYNSLFHQQQYRLQKPQNNLPVNYNQAIKQPAKIEIEEGASKILKPSKEDMRKLGIFKQKNSQANPMKSEKKPTKNPGQKSEEKPTKKVELTKNGFLPQKPNEKVDQKPTEKPTEKVVKIPSEIYKKSETVKKEQTPSPTVSKAPKEEFWSKSEVDRFKSSYSRKVSDEGKTFTKVANLTFFTHYLKAWKEVSTDGKAPQVSVQKRREWFEKTYPEKAAKLKAADAKKRKKKST